MLPHDLRGLMPDLYFVNASAAQMEHHRALLERLPQERRIIEFLRPHGTLLTELSLCAYDDTKPGLLTRICGTLAALHVSVHTASIFTLRDGAPIVLDTLLVSETYLRHDRKLSTAKQKEIEETLTKVLDGQTSVAQLLKASRRWPWLSHWPLRIHEVRAEAAPQAGQCIITAHVGKSQAAIFRMAGAMASLGLDIQTAQIHESKNEVQGVFFVTGADDDSDLATRLRQALQNNAMPLSLSQS
jgi:UTP:GlnB (protein PII) uridylyltransferase